MGQATVDLPDPLESPSTMKAAGADDLLAQMAGEEIDRLLAEAEADSVPVEPPKVAAEDAGPVAFPATATSAASSEPKDSTNESLAGELDSLLTTLVTAREPGNVPAEAAPPAAVETQNIPTSETESGVSSMESAGLLSGTVEETDDAVGRTVTETVDAAPLPEASAALLEETSAAERQALASAPVADAVATQQMDKAVAAAADAAVEEPEPESKGDASLPLLLRPLEWLNAPFAACPDFLRELVGKAAILTVVNATAVIFYVRFIRRH